MAKKNSISKQDDNTPWLRSGIVSVDRCKLCHSKYREEAEALYEKTKNLKRVAQFLQDDRAEDITYGAVRNHLMHHYNAVNSIELVKSNLEHIQDWTAIQGDQPEALLRTMAMLEREMHILEAESEGLSQDARRKNADTVAKLATVLLNYRTKYYEMEQSREPVTIVFNQLQIIMKEELKAVKDQKTKKVVSNILNRFKDSCGDYIIESIDE